MPVNPVKKAIKEAKFIKALVDNTGNATEAYKTILPQVTHGSAKVGGSKELAKINPQDINVLLDKIGGDKETVLTDLVKRMKTASDPNFARFTTILVKIAGWDRQNGNLHDILTRDLDLIEVVKIRLKKRSNTNDLQKPIDIDVISTNTNSDEK